jgi:carboxylesterase type B
MPCQYTTEFSTLSTDLREFTSAENSSTMWRLCFGLLLTTVLALAGRFDPAPLEIVTTSGQVTGFINDTAPTVRQFLGIPFSEPPLGPRRFLAPLRKRDNGPINATAYAPACKQQKSTSPSVYTEFMPEFLLNGGDSEDCLYLNVYAPLNPKNEKLPVLLYIPGGGFTGGGSDSSYKIPDKWIQETQSHIVVTLQ